MDAFKFPDEDTSPIMSGDELAGDAVEFSIEGEGDVDVEIVDDTPPEDKGRKALDKPVDDVTDEELESYSDKVKKRISELSHAKHDERRAKEAIERQARELEVYTQRVLEENRKLKEYVSNGEQVYAGTLLESAQAKVDAAKRVYKEAVESYDPDQIVEAQSALNEAQWNLAEAKKFKPTPLQAAEEPVYSQTSQQESPRPDDKTVRWQARNQWFGEDDEMTAVALAAHKKLVANGVDPRSDEYFERIDARMRDVYPDYFGQSRKEARKPATVVAPSSRSTKAKKVVLTSTQVALAKRLGVPLDVYAKQIAKEEAQNG